MYSRQKMPLDKTHTLRTNVDAKTYLEHQISNYFSVFDDADHAADQRTRRSLTSLLVLLTGVLVDYKFEQQGCIALHSTDAEIVATLAGTKKAIYFYDLGVFLDLHNNDKPIKIYQDSQPCIDIVTSGTISKRVKHICVPVHYIHEKVIKGYIDLEYISTSLQPADPGTKATSAPILFRAMDYAIGVRFYPPPESEHATLMELSKYNACRKFTIHSTKSQSDGSKH